MQKEKKHLFNTWMEERRERGQEEQRKEGAKEKEGTSLLM